MLPARLLRKTTRVEHMVQNGDVFSFQLRDEEIKRIDKLNVGKRFAWKGLDPDTVE